VLAQLLADHRTLTAAQVTALLFTTPGTARNRLRQLRELGFLERFTHRTPTGAKVTCWVPGLLSARYTALAAGQPAPTPRAVRQMQDRILANPQLDHLLGVNQFFTDVARHARTHPGSRLRRWWSAERTAAAFAGRIHPDGHGLWQTRHPGPPVVDQVHERDGATADDETGAAGDVAWSTVGFWLEHDTGSMPLARVVAKFGAYHRLQQGGGPTYPVLLWLPSVAREANLHRLLADEPAARHVTVATAVHGTGTHPAGAVWSVTGASAPTDGSALVSARVRLQDLSGGVSGPGPLNPPADDDGTFPPGAIEPGNLDL
jgi:hypothetical protein